MNRATPVQMRKALETGRTLERAGIRFVPVPVLNDEDHAQLLNQVQDRLDQMLKQAPEGDY